MEGADQGRLVRTSASSTSRAAASGTPPRSACRCQCGRSSLWASSRPDDVAVQLIHGKVSSEDVLVETTIDELDLAESYEGGRHRFDCDVTLGHSGAFGYTVRVVPRNDLLISSAELGVVAMA